MSSRARIAALAAPFVGLGLGLGLAGLGCNRSAPSAPPSDRIAKPGDVAPAAQPAKAARPGDVGTHAPAAQLSQTSGAKIALADLLPRHARTVVVFYRGFW